MTNIKETIQGLYALKTYLASKAIEEHGPARESLIGMQQVVDSAVNLLKEREAKKVIMDLYGNYCPWCSTKTTRTMGVQKLRLGTKFCPYCGKAVSFE